MGRYNKAKEKDKAFFDYASAPDFGESFGGPIVDEVGGFALDEDCSCDMSFLDTEKDSSISEENCFEASYNKVNLAFKNPNFNSIEERGFKGYSQKSY